MLLRQDILLADVAGPKIQTFLRQALNFNSKQGHWNSVKRQGRSHLCDKVRMWSSKQVTFDQHDQVGGTFQ